MTDNEKATIPGTDRTEGVLDEVADERTRQVTKWGVQTRPTGANAAFSRARDLAQKRTDARMKDGTATWHDILFEEFLEAVAEEDAAKMRVELIQLAAVAVSAVEDIDRKAAGEVAP